MSLKHDAGNVPFTRLRLSVSSAAIIATSAAAASTGIEVPALVGPVALPAALEALVVRGGASAALHLPTS